MQHKYKQHHYHHYHYKFSQIQLNNSITKTQLAEQQGLKGKITAAPSKN